MIRKILCLTVAFFTPLAGARASELDKLVAQWVQLEQQANAVEQQWRERQPILQQQLDLLDAQADSLTSLLSQESSQSDDIEHKRQTLLEQQSDLERAQDKMRFTLDKTQLQLADLAGQLPPPLQKQWEKSLAVLETLNGNSERLEKQLELFSSLDSFNHRLAVQQGVKSFEDGKQIQVEEVYLGASVGWYVSRDGRYWGSGTSTPMGWQWQNQPEYLQAQDVQKLLQMLKNSGQGRLMAMPLPAPASEKL